jgi:hypothetical protein
MVKPIRRNSRWLISERFGTLATLTVGPVTNLELQNLLA